MNDGRRPHDPAISTDDAHAHDGAFAAASEERRVERDVSALLIAVAVVAFVFLAIGGFGPWWANLIIVAVFYATMVTVGRPTGVAERGAGSLRLSLIVSGSLAWIVLCNAYFVNWNPHQLPGGPLLGAVVAAAPPLVLARWYRP